MGSLCGSGAGGRQNFAVGRDCTTAFYRGCLGSSYLSAIRYVFGSKGSRLNKNPRLHLVSASKTTESRSYSAATIGVEAPFRASAAGKSPCAPSATTTSCVSPGMISFWDRVASGRQGDAGGQP